MVEKKIQDLGGKVSKKILLGIKFNQTFSFSDILYFDCPLLSKSSWVESLPYINQGQMRKLLSPIIYEEDLPTKEVWNIFRVLKKGNHYKLKQAQKILLYVQPKERVLPRPASLIRHKIWMNVRKNLKITKEVDHQNSTFINLYQTQRDKNLNFESGHLNFTKFKVKNLNDSDKIWMDGRSAFKALVLS